MLWGFCSPCIALSEASSCGEVEWTDPLPIILEGRDTSRDFRAVMSDQLHLAVDAAQTGSHQSGRSSIQELPLDRSAQLMLRSIGKGPGWAQSAHSEGCA